MQVKWSEMKLPLGSIWAAIKTLQIDLPPFNNQTATPFSNRQCLSLCVCLCVCVRLCVPLTSATRSTPQVPQHALITINDGSQGGVRQRVRWLWWQHLLLPIWNFSKLAAPHSPPPPVPPAQLVAQVGQAQNLSPIIVDIVYGCQRPQRASQSHLICRRLLQWQSTPGYPTPLTLPLLTLTLPPLLGLSLLGLHHVDSFHFLLITFSCNAAN